MLYLKTPDGKAFPISSITSDEVMELHNEHPTYADELIELEIKYEATLDTGGTNDDSYYESDIELSPENTERLIQDLRQLIQKCSSP